MDPILLRDASPMACYTAYLPGMDAIRASEAPGVPIEKNDDPSPSTDWQPLGSEDAHLVSRLRAGDQAAFVEIIRSLGPTMLRIARLYVRSQEVAEEVV